MIDTISRFADELRRVEIPVSLAELTDAVEAVRSIDFAERDDLRVALRATMVKRSEHLDAFDVVFDLYFGDIRAAPAAGKTVVFHTLTDDELAASLRDALAADNRPVLRRIADAAVDRYAEMEPGRPVAGRAYLFRVLRSLDLDRLVADIGAAEPARSPLELRLRRDRLGATVAYVESTVELEIRRRLVADRGAGAVAKVVRPPLQDAIGFMNASSAEIVAMRRAITPLVRTLGTRLARRQRLRQRGPLDFRRTIRASLSTGGTPVQLRFKPPAKPKPELVVIADVSGSVATFARFTLQLLYAMRLQFRKIRTFAFIDDLVEVTDVLVESVTAEQAFATITADPRLIWLDGRSDYGHALETFTSRYASAVRSSTSVLILGDGRNNYRSPQEERLRLVARRAAHVYWLNPERQANWNTGDSAIHHYAPHCDRVVECANLAQLRNFADTLL
ncbi:VWA domain-containing protein [Dactylosporangium sp. NPDC000555]|uniref:vWA domain-containing protein n=1 Tax=Dactylosporangium sp. NPDC000555 TaxID=3154260 RepID=UPI003318E7A1